MSGTELEPVLEPDLPIVDAHHHLWNASPFGHLQAFSIEQLAEDRKASGHDIRATVYAECRHGYLEGGPEALRPVGETRWVNAEAERAARAGGDLAGLAAGIVGHADMRLGAEVQPVLEAHLAEAPDRFRGVRHITSWSPEADLFPGDVWEGMLCSPPFIEGLKVMTGLGLTLDVQPIFSQLRDAAALARAVPDATLILDHVGFPLGRGSFEGRQDEVLAVWRQGMAEVAACPNIVVKLGGLLTRFSGLTPPETGGCMSSEEVAQTCGRYILPAIDMVGPERCLFESNFPVDRGYISYRNVWNGFKRLTRGFTRAEREQMFCRTATDIYRLPAP